MDRVAIGKKIKLLREKRNITQNKLATEAGISASYVASLEKKENETEVNIQPTSIKPRISIQEIDDRLLTIDDFL